MFTPIEVELTDKSHVVLSIVIHPHSKREGAAMNTRDEAEDFTLRISSSHNLGSEYRLRYLKHVKFQQQNLLKIYKP